MVHTTINLAWGKFFFDVVDFFLYNEDELREAGGAENCF